MEKKEGQVIDETKTAGFHVYNITEFDVRKNMPWDGFEFKKIKRSDFTDHSNIMLTIGGAQELCDALWGAGIRPTEGHGSVGQLAATEANLSDMRRIAFDLLDNKLKK